jgi:Asp-tRNA(Asn)/Glu-tRNA(Gln) amidotransferase A subunit family amidase
MTNRCDSAVQTAARIRAGEETATGATEAALARIEAREDAVQAWQYLDPARARAEAAACDSAGATGPLAGVSVGLKDIIDTADQPTENGAAPDKGRQPAEDATVVTRLRKAGAVILGKTVTTECAYFSPGKTRNPHDPTRTPGGSSSGSGAVVGDGMVPLALGTQTVGSVLRPASFCGTWGMKPTYGLIPRTGVMPMSHSLDHVGVYGRAAEDLAVSIDVLSGDDGTDPPCAGRSATRLAAALSLPRTKPHLALVRDFAWPEIEPSTADLIEGAAKTLDAEALPLPAVLDGVYSVEQTVLKCEMAHHMRARYETGADKLTPILRECIEEGRTIPATDYFAALDAIAEMRRAVGRTLAGYDAVITAVVPGEAPVGLGATGNPKFCLLWTTVGVPAISVPAFTGPAGLPVGLQVIGVRGSDATVLRAAAWIADELGVTLA